MRDRSYIGDLSIIQNFSRKERKKNKLLGANHPRAYNRDGESTSGLIFVFFVAKLRLKNRDYLYSTKTTTFRVFRAFRG